jgi:hypothetical protein
VLWGWLKGESTSTLANSHFTFYVGGGFALLCYLVYAMIFGAWLGGVLCFVWRSPAGKRWFWTLSGGTVGGTFAVVAAVQLLLLAGPSSRGHMWLYMIGYGAGILMVTLTGSLIGNLIGRRFERTAELAAYSSNQDQA